MTSQDNGKITDDNTERRGTALNCGAIGYHPYRLTTNKSIG